MSKGYTCDGVATGWAAIECLEKGNYDLLISDIEMPGNEDLLLIRRAAEIAPGLPVLLVTGYPSVTTAVDSHSLPVFAYLLKPLDYSILSKHIEGAVRQHRLYKAVRTTEARMAGWTQDLAELRSGIQFVSSGNLDTNLQGYVSLAFQNMIGTMEELKIMLEIAYQRRPDTDLCSIVNCALREEYEHALEGAVDSLRATKNSFKSKEIADLRRRFEMLLENQKRSGRPSRIE